MPKPTTKTKKRQRPRYQTVTTEHSPSTPSKPRNEVSITPPDRPHEQADKRQKSIFPETITPVEPFIYKDRAILSEKPDQFPETGP